VQEFVEAYRLRSDRANKRLALPCRAKPIIDRFRKREIARQLKWLTIGRAAGRVPADLALRRSMRARSGVRAIVILGMQRALDELPSDQREVFFAHELEGRSSRILRYEVAGNNTLLARKRYAVLYLRRRLQTVYYELIFEGVDR